jgi:hypothetical protein
MWSLFCASNQYVISSGLSYFGKYKFKMTPNEVLQKIIKLISFKRPDIDILGVE